MAQSTPTDVLSTAGASWTPGNGSQLGEGLALTGKEMTVHVRLNLANAPDGPVLSTADASAAGRIIDVSNGMLNARWQTTPLADRVVAGTLAEPRLGFNGESNDRHDLLPYRSGEWGISVMTVEAGRTVTLLHNGEEASGEIDPGIQDVGDTLVRVGAKHNDIEWLSGEIAEVVVYGRALDDAGRRGLYDYLAAEWGLGDVAAEPPAGDLVLRLDARDLGEGAVDQWPNRVGGPGLQQPDESRRPRLVDDVLNGRPAVRFDGAQCLDGSPVLEAGADSFTVAAVWRRDDAAGSEVLFEQASPGRGKRACLLTTGSQGHGSAFLDGTLWVGVPLDETAADGAVDVVLRFRGPNLDFFVDGVLVDEEWPHGALNGYVGPFVVDEAYLERVARVALWDRALSDDEIAGLSGGSEVVERRTLEILGPPQASIQYWKPRGHNAYAGDCMPFYYDGVFHLFYLHDRRHHQSKWGLGAHQYAHVTTRDLIHWEHHPLAVPIIRQWECAMGTGDAIEKDGVIHVFYTDCGGRCEFTDKPRRGSWIFAARSEDGVHFEKDLVALVPGHDCEVFQDPATGLYHLVRGGENRLVSEDLRNWEDVPGDFVERRPDTSPECPNHFEWNGWFYFILGRNALWRSRSAIGPWEEIPPNVYDGLMVPKVGPFTGNRRLLAGFLEYPGWGGNIVMRELVQHPGGTLGMRWVPELVPASGDPVELALSVEQGAVTVEGTEAEVDGTAGLAICAVDGAPRDAHLTLRIEPGPGVTAYGVAVRGAEGYSGCELKLEPEGERAQWGTPRDGKPAPDSNGGIWAGGEFPIESVKRLNEPISLDIVMTESIIDACIDGRRTMVTRRRSATDGHRIYLFAEGGSVRVTGLTVRPLVGE